MYNPETGHQLTDILELHFIEIKKYDTRKPVSSMNRKERWMAFLANKLTRKMKEDLMSAEPLINEAYNMANIFMLDEKSRLQYINRQMAIRDFNNARRVAYNDGRIDINNLNAWLFKHKRFDDVARATEDSIYQDKLMAEYKAAMKNQSE